MKTMRKAVAFLAILGLTLALWVPMAVSAEVTESPAAVAAPEMATRQNLLYFGRSILEKMDNSRALCYAYDKLVDGLRNGEKDIDISHRTYEISWEEAETICELVRSDHPELYSVSSIGYSGGEYVSAFHGYYDAEAMAYADVIDRRVEQLTAGLEKKSDYEKSLILHDRLCDAVVYTFNDHDQTVVGSLALGISVCAGYARGYQLLLQELGIPCFYVVGYSRNQGHAWNLVQLDGEWYYTDVTWDDQNDSNTAGSGIYYSYLNVTYEQISEDHEASAYVEYLPKSTATANNYYIKNGLVLDPSKPLDVKKLAKAFKENYPPQLYYVGDNAMEGVQLIFNNLQKIVKEMMGKTPYSGINANAGLLGNGITIYLEVVHNHTFSTTTMPASCLVGGTKTNRCGDCGYTTKEAIPATGHDLTAPWHNATHHGYQCANCGLTDALEAHVYLQDGITCDTCGYVADTCTHRFDVITVYPTCIEDGHKLNVCVHCGEEQIVETIPATGHDFSDLWQDATHHGAQCSGCGMADALEEHTYEQDGITCDTCGYMATECHHRYAAVCDRCCDFCGEERSVDETHTYDDDQDADCNLCGEEREVITVVYGDASGDGKVNNKDLGLLQQMLNDWEVELDMEACDVNKDGKVNNKDLGLLQQYLNDWDVVLG